MRKVRRPSWGVAALLVEATRNAFVVLDDQGGLWPGYLRLPAERACWQVRV